MKIALIVSFLVMSLALDAQTLQGKVVRVADGVVSFLLVKAITSKESDMKRWD